jgi:hypothetical protein
VERSTKRRKPGRGFEVTLRRIRERIETVGKAPHMYVTAEVLAGGQWLELVARCCDGDMIARTGWSLEYFSEDTLEDISEWLEAQAARATGRHLRVMG